MRTVWIIGVMIAVMVSLWTPCLGHAASLKSKAASSVTEAVNPHPADTDILLPMPCKLGMVFKAVDVPAKGFLSDTTFSMGSETPGRPGMDYYDRRYAASIAAPFAAGDMPAAWQGTLPKASDVPLFFYLVGKYEITEAQWQAVMDSVCPQEPLNANAARPKTGISWYDVQEFLKKYNQWLLDNAKDVLPQFAGDTRNRGFVRLPGEAEWEFAARGGSRVPKEVLNQEAFPPLAEGTTLNDYAVFRPANAATVQEGPAPVGSRLPNPLGLYDTAGNVAEMVQDSFHFSLGMRLHGSAGGYVRKGGGFSGGEADIMPGSREEVAFFNDRGPVSARDLGVRLVLSGINTPGGARTQTLMSEWQQVGENAVVVREGGTPLQELDRLIEATQNPGDKANLSRLRALIKDDNIALEAQRNATAEGVIRTAVYMSETVRNYGVRFNIAHRRVLEVGEVLKKAQEQKKPKDQIDMYQKSLKQFEEARTDMMVALEASANFYKTKLEETAEFPKAVIDYNYNLVDYELKQDNLLARHMRQNLETFGKHLALFRAGKFDALTKVRIINDILPENLKAGMKL